MAMINTRQGSNSRLGNATDTNGPSAHNRAHGLAMAMDEVA